MLPTVPDAEARLGNIPDCVVTIGILSTTSAGTPLPPSSLCNTNQIDALPLSPTSQAIMALYPTGGASAVEQNLPGGQNSICASQANPNPLNCGPTGVEQITVNAPEPANEDYSTLVGTTYSPKKTRFSDAMSSTMDRWWIPPSRPVGLYPETSKGRNQYVTIGDKEVFSSNLINDARFTFTRSNMRAFVTGENPVLQFFSFYGENRQDGTVIVTGGPSPIGPSAFTPDFELQNIFSLNDDVFWVHGKHSFEIGAEFRRLQSPLANGFFEDQGWNFPSYASFVEGSRSHRTHLLSLCSGRFRDWRTPTEAFGNRTCPPTFKTPGKCRAP